MNIDLSELVRDSLLSQGCDSGMLGDFDGHSTIAMEFDGIPDIMISEANEQVVIWCRLAEYNKHIIDSCADRLLSMVMEPIFYSITGQLQLGEDEGYTVLKSIVVPSALNSDDFSRVLEEFYVAIEEFLKVLH